MGFVYRVLWILIEALWIVLSETINIFKEIEKFGSTSSGGWTPGPRKDWMEKDYSKESEGTPRPMHLSQASQEKYNIFRDAPKIFTIGLCT